MYRVNYRPAYASGRSPIGRTDLRSVLAESTRARVSEVTELKSSGCFPDLSAAVCGGG